MAEQNHEAKETSEVPTAEQTTGSASLAEGAAPAQSTSGMWEVSPPPPRKEQMNNPFLAGVPAKPRCSGCNMLLDKGVCAEPDCDRFGVVPGTETKPSCSGDEGKMADEATA